MGNICHEASNLSTLDRKDRPDPHPAYAVPMTVPPDFPMPSAQIK